ncbi:MAG: hypothetical protein POG74_12300 [Acidocella sp.]|nr:hypothetical protein [Acidocella sp.]
MPAIRDWQLRLTIRVCLSVAALLMGGANRLRRAGLLRHSDAGLAVSGATWLANRAMQAWRRSHVNRM